MLAAIPLIILVLFFIAPSTGLLTRQQSGGFVSWLAKVLEKTPIFAGLFTIEDVVRLDRWVTHELGKAFKAVEHAGVSWLAALAHYVDVVGYWSLYWPIALVHEVQHLTSHTIPRAINARVQPLDKRIDVAEATAKAAAGVAHSNTVVIRKGGTVKEVTRIERVAMPHAQEWEWIHNHWKAVRAAVLGTAAAAVGVAIPGGIAWENPLNVLRRSVNKRFAKVNALLGVGSLAVLMAGVLGLKSPSCLRTGNVGKAARRLCGLDNLIMDALLADIAFTAGTISIVELAKATQKAAPLVATSLVFFVDDIPIAVKDAEAIGKRALKILESVA